jgi:hypothetical protein
MEYVTDSVDKTKDVTVASRRPPLWPLWAVPVRLWAVAGAVLCLVIGLPNISDGAAYQRRFNTEAATSYCSGQSNTTAVGNATEGSFDCFLMTTPFRGADNVAVSLILLAAAIAFRVREAAATCFLWQASSIIMIAMRGSHVPSEYYQDGEISSLNVLNAAAIAISAVIVIPTLVRDARAPAQ